MKRMAGVLLWILAVALFGIWAAVTACQIYVSWQGWLE
jgi:hypothetical protein